jgi:hypothetical protein
MEHFFAHFKELGPWVVSVVGTVLAWLLRRAIKEIKSLGATQIKADLAYEEVSQRVPEVKMKYEFWQAHR